MHDKALSKGDVNMRWVSDGKSFTTDCCRLLTGLNQNTFRTFHIFFFNLKKF